MTRRPNHDELVACATRHAAAEGVGDMATVFATLEDEPVYELQPAGLVFRGAELTRRYYEHFFGTFQSLVAGFDLRSEWVYDDGVAQEYTMWTATGPDGALERHEVIGVLVFGSTKLSGERVYASDRVLRLMFGPLYDLATPIEIGVPPS